MVVCLPEARRRQVGRAGRQPRIFLEAAHGEMVKASVRMFWQRPAASVSRERFKSVLVKVTFPASSLFFTVLA